MPIVFQPAEPQNTQLNQSFGALQQYEKDRDFNLKQRAQQQQEGQQGFDQQMQVAKFQAGQQASPRDEFMANKQFEQGEQLQANQAANMQLQHSLATTMLTFKEQQRMSQLQNAVGAVNDNPDLSDEEKHNLITQIQTKINPLQQRHAAAQMQLLETQKQKMQQQSAQQETMFNEHMKFRAKNFSDRIAQHQGLDGEVHEYIQNDKGGFDLAPHEKIKKDHQLEIFKQKMDAQKAKAEATKPFDHQKERQAAAAALLKLMPKDDKGAPGWSQEEFEKRLDDMVENRRKAHEDFNDRQEKNQKNKAELQDWNKQWAQRGAQQGVQQPPPGGAILRPQDPQPKPMGQPPQQGAPPANEGVRFQGPNETELQKHEMARYQELQQAQQHRSPEVRSAARAMMQMMAANRNWLKPGTPEHKHYLELSDKMEEEANPQIKHNAVWDEWGPGEKEAHDKKLEAERVRRLNDEGKRRPPAKTSGPAAAPDNPLWRKAQGEE